MAGIAIIGMVDAARETEVAADEIDSTQCEAPGAMILRCSPRCLEFRRARNVFRVRENSAHHNSALPVHLRSYSTAPLCLRRPGLFYFSPAARCGVPQPAIVPYSITAIKSRDCATVLSAPRAILIANVYLKERLRR